MIGEERSTLLGIALPSWAKKWFGAPFLFHPYPVLSGLLGFVLLLVLPDDVLSRYPLLRHFTDFMGWLVPGIPAFAANKASESVLIVHALAWAQIPLWLPLYHKYYPIYHPRLLMQKAFKNAHRLEIQHLIVALSSPVIVALVTWVTWSGFLFAGGEPVLIKGLVYNSWFAIACWSYFLPHGFLMLFFIFVLTILSYPILLKTIFLKIFFRSKS